EVDLTVSLAEMQVTDRVFRAVEVHRIVHPRASREVHDVHVSAVLPRGNRARPLLRDAVGGLLVCGAGEGRSSSGRNRERGYSLGIGSDERLLPPVPLGQEIGGGGSARESGVLNTRIANSRDVARGALLAAEVPHRLVRVGKVVGEESATVYFREDPGIPPPFTAVLPLGLGGRADVDDVDDEQVAGLGSL